jgi:hypothetical protein
VVLESHKASDINETVLFGAHYTAVSIGKHLLSYSYYFLISITGLSLPDKVAVLSEACSIKKEGHLVTTAEFGC